MFVMSQHIDAIIHMIRARQRALDGYRQDVRIMDCRWVQHVYSRFTKEEANIKKAIELGAEPEPVDWDMRATISPMTGYRDTDILPWDGAREILFVVNFQNLHWFTFRIDIEAWTITVLDCQKDLMQSSNHQKDFTELMEVRKMLCYSQLLP